MYFYSVSDILYSGTFPKILMIVAVQVATREDAVNIYSGHHQYSSLLGKFKLSTLYILATNHFFIASKCA